MKRILIGATLMVAGVAGVAGATPVAAENHGTAPLKVFVCKYVTMPDGTEVLKDGKNPIEVSDNAIPAKREDGRAVVVGDLFADGQVRSVVVQVGGESSTTGPCPGEEAPIEVMPVEAMAVKPASTMPTCVAAGTVEIRGNVDAYTYDYVTAAGVTTVTAKAKAGFVLVGDSGPWTYPITQLTGAVCDADVASNPPLNPTNQTPSATPTVGSTGGTLGSATPVVGSAGPLPAQAAPTQALPATGTSSWVLAFTAMALVLIGSGFVSFSRRYS